MLPSSLSRPLFSAAASSARACQSSVSRSATATASWEYVRRSASLIPRPPNRSVSMSQFHYAGYLFNLKSSQIQNRLAYPKNTLQQRSSFSTASAAFAESSSPFRLSSKSSSSSSTESPTGAPSEGQSNVDYEGATSDEYYSPHQPKRQWPPDMSKLSPKHQFRLERKYRRRAALKYARPKWVKATKLVQWGIIGCE